MPRPSRIPLHPALAPYVEEILVEDPSSVLPVETEPYRVLPKLYPVIGFQSRGRLSVLREERPETLSRCGITGVQTTFRRFQAEPGTRTVLVALKPFGAYPLLGCDMNEVADAHVGLDALLAPSWMSRVEERMAGTRSAEEGARIVESFFLSLLDRSRRRVHPVVMEAAGRIAAGRGSERVEVVARELGVSRRQMERLFLAQVGVGPKGFASLSRLQWVLANLGRRRSWADLAFEAGYSDQAHFVRTFRERVGMTPGEYERTSR
jgi:AraC-like DNA-binding protein